MLCFPCQNGNLLLASLLLRDIRRDLRCSDDFALRVFDRRDGQRNENQAAILALPYSLELVDPLPLPDAC